MSDPEIWSLAPGDDGYPACLADLAEQPSPTLYGVGGRSVMATLDHAAAITIVGSRRASAYGLRAAETLARDLATAGVTIISGMALGIDAAAHRGALAGGGRTIAVLANGPDVVYPARHRPLYERIVSSGAIVSEHPAGVRPRKHFFTQRNRIMAALGRVVIIAEAAQPSGSLITAEAANDLGRTVGAVPGQVGARNAAGANGLIKDGAQLIRHAQDVLDLLFGVGHPGRGAPKVALEPPLGDVLELVRSGASTLDRLAHEGGLASQEAAAALSRLELLGFVACDPFGSYTPTGIGG